MSQRREKDGQTLEPAGPESDDSSFVKRWSRRKRDALSGAEPGGFAEAADTAGSGEISPQDDDSTVSALTDADMPAVESLGEDSEYGGFLSPGVSEELRKLALRKLFHLPGFNVRDGLDDYDEDFTRFAALGEVMTQDLRHRIKTAARRDAERRQSSDGAPQSPLAAEAAEAAEAGEVQGTEDADLVDAEESGAAESLGDLANLDDRERR